MFQGGPNREHEGWVILEESLYHFTFHSSLLSIVGQTGLLWVLSSLWDPAIRRAAAASHRGRRKAQAQTVLLSFQAEVRCASRSLANTRHVTARSFSRGWGSAILVGIDLEQHQGPHGSQTTSASGYCTSPLHPLLSRAFS